jgi:hypothetical protein
MKAVETARAEILERRSADTVTQLFNQEQDSTGQVYVISHAHLNYRRNKARN